MRKTKPSTVSTSDVISRYEIAKILGRSPSSVNQRIKELNLRPSITLGRFQFYPPAVVDKLKKVMRRPNYNQRCLNS